MADEVKGKNSKDDNKKEVFVPQSAYDVQKMKIDKLMNNPVSYVFYVYLKSNEDVCVWDVFEVFVILFNLLCFRINK